MGKERLGSQNHHEPTDDCAEDGIPRNHHRWIEKYVPVFPLSGDQCHILTEPEEFYNALKLKAKRATERIVIASLYLGTGSLEKQLVDIIHGALEESRANRGGKLKVQILLDKVRGSRGEVNSRTLLLPLLREHGDSLSVSLFHTPKLRGLKKALIPERFNEAIGLQHMKVYLFDNSAIISGANLSDTYFTTRQDRYILIEDCPDLTDFLHNLILTVSKYSLQLTKENSTILDPHHTSPQLHPFKGDEKRFSSELKEKVKQLFLDQNSVSGGTTKEAIDIWDSETENLSPPRSPNSETEDLSPPGTPDYLPSGAHADTWVYPLVQIPPVGVKVDEKVTRSILQRLGRGSRCCLASGYFNLTQGYTSNLIQSAAHCHILMASPQANGFYGSRDISGLVPLAYTCRAKHFWDQVEMAGQGGRISLQQYFRRDWTFHAKGLWYYPPGHDLPSLTLLGSPNFGYRSVFRDVEMEVAISTSNVNLRKQLHREQKKLFSFSSPVTKQSLTSPIWARIVSRIIRSFF